MADDGRKEGKDWPSWRYGPDEQAGIFVCEDDVPEGWVDHPSKVGEAIPKPRGRKPKADAPSENPPLDI